MCGELKRDPAKLKAALQSFGDITFSEYARPGHPTPVLRMHDGHHDLVSRIWGWGTEVRELGPPKIGTYNTRIETFLQDMTSFWRQGETERLALPTQHFREGRAYFSSPDNEILWLLGIGNGTEVSVFTMPANAQVRPWHGRMPIVATSSNVDTWLVGGSFGTASPTFKVIA